MEKPRKSEEDGWKQNKLFTKAYLHGGLLKIFITVSDKNSKGAAFLVFL